MLQGVSFRKIATRFEFTAFGLSKFQTIQPLPRAIQACPEITTFDYLKEIAIIPLFQSG
jgi:hypothetical protein